MDHHVRNGGIRAATKGHRIGDAWKDITLSCLILTIPMVLFSAILLGLVFHYRVSHHSAPFANLLVGDEQDEPGVYYVKLNATILIFISSWASSLAPALAGFALTLNSFPVTKRLLEAQGRDDVRDLPTPYQLALMLRFISGSTLSSLWTWVKYLFQWRAKRQHQASALRHTASVALLATLLG